MPREVSLRRTTSITQVQKHIIILSQARSGSTLLQRILHCCIDGGNIMGENEGFWIHIAKSYYSLFKALKRPENKIGYLKTDNIKPCWRNTIGINELIAHYRALFNKMYEGDKSRVIGFKEVRFPESSDEFDRFIKFFQRLLPNVLFLFTVRNIDTIIQSGWWSESDREHLFMKETLLREYACNHTDCCLIVEYENMTDEASMKKVFDFLNEPLNTEDYHRVITKIL